MEKETELLTEKIFSSFLYWKNNLCVKRYNNYDSLDLKRKIEAIVIKLMQNNNHLLLTDDLIYFVTLNSFYELKYIDEFLKQFAKIVDLDYKGWIDLISRYYNRLLSGTFDNRFHGYYECIRLMKYNNKDIFQKTISLLESLKEKNLNDDEYQKLMQLIIRIAAYSIVKNDANLLEKVYERYFTNISNTMEKFKLYGIITNDPNNKVDFIDFVNLDLDKEEQGVITK